MKKQIIKMVGAGYEAATQLTLFLRSCIVIFQKKFFFFSGFCFTTIHESQDCRGIGGHLFNSSLPLPPASQAFTH